MAKRQRQQWINGAERPCQHDIIDVVKTQGGGPLADRCAACLLVLAQYGTCAGCGKGPGRRLALMVSARRSAYCSTACHSAQLKREREAAAAKEAKAKAAAGAR